MKDNAEEIIQIQFISFKFFVITISFEPLPRRQLSSVSKQREDNHAVFQQKTKSLNLLL